MNVLALDPVEYKALHHQVSRRFTKHGVCEICGHEKRTCWASIDHTYTLEREDWLELCYSCHRWMDSSQACSHGHVYSAENTYFDKLGKPHCRVCQRRRETDKRRAAGIPSGPHRKGGRPTGARNAKGQFICLS